MQLYITQRSPFARIVRIALIEKGLARREVSVDLSKLPDDFLKKNPGGTVPTLEDEGVILGDSQQILHYLETNYPEPPLLPHTIEAHYAGWQWIALANRLCEQQVGVFFERQKELAREAVFTKAAAITGRIIAALETKLGTKSFILGEYSLADIAMGAVMKWMEFRLPHDWASLSEPVQAWLKNLDGREGFQATRPRLD